MADTLRLFPTGPDDPLWCELLAEYEANEGKIDGLLLCRRLKGILHSGGLLQRAEDEQGSVQQLEGEEQVEAQAGDGSDTDETNSSEQSGDKNNGEDSNDDIDGGDSQEEEEDEHTMRRKLRRELDRRVQAGAASREPLAGSGAAAAAALSPSRSPVKRRNHGGAGAFRVDRAPCDHIQSVQDEKTKKEEQRLRREAAQAQQEAEKAAKRRAINERARMRKRRIDMKLERQRCERERRRQQRQSNARADGRHGAASIPFQRCMQQPHYLDNVSNPAKELVLPGSTAGVDGAMVRRRLSVAQEDKAPRAALALLKRKSPTRRQQKGRGPGAPALGQSASEPTRGRGGAPSSGDAELDAMWSSASQTGLGQLRGEKSFKGWKTKGGKLSDTLGRPLDPNCRRRIPHKCGPNCPYRRDAHNNTPKKTKLKAVPRPLPLPVADDDVGGLDQGLDLGDTPQHGPMKGVLAGGEAE
eukprot:g7775.t1